MATKIDHVDVSNSLRTDPVFVGRFPDEAHASEAEQWFRRYAAGKGKSVETERLFGRDVFPCECGECTGFACLGIDLALDNYRDLGRF